MTIKDSWKRDYYKKVAEELAITQLTPDIPKLSETDKEKIYDFPRWELINYVPDKSKPNESLFLYGNSALLPLQLSLVDAIKTMLSWQSNNDNYQGNPLIKRAGNPLIKLFFEEDKPANIKSKDFTPVQGRISWRLMDYLEFPNNYGKKVLDWEKIEQIANKIFNEFQKPNNNEGFLWDKGKISFNYQDPVNGYGLKIHCQTEQGGRELLDKILRINGHSYSEINASITSPKNTDDYRDGREIVVLGEKQQQPRYRPKATVRFKSAELKLSKKSTPIHLINRGFVGHFPQ